MKDEKYLVIEKYDDQEIRFVVDGKLDSGILDSVCIFYKGEFLSLFLGKSVVCNDKPVIIHSGYHITERDFCNLFFKDLELIEQSIDIRNNNSHEKTDNRVLYIYMMYLGKMIELYVDLDYNARKVWYSNGVSLRSVSFDDAFSSIIYEFESAKNQIDDSISKRNKRIELIAKLEEFKNDLLRKHYVKKYPELFV